MEFAISSWYQGNHRAENHLRDKNTGFHRYNLTFVDVLRLQSLDVAQRSLSQLANLIRAVKNVDVEIFDMDDTMRSRQLLVI